MMRATTLARLARLEGMGGGYRTPDPASMAIKTAVICAAADIANRTATESRMGAVARLLGMSEREMRAWMMAAPQEWWGAVVRAVQAAADRQGVALDALLMEAAERYDAWKARRGTATG